MNPNTYIQLNQKSRAMAHAGAVDVAYQLKQQSHLMASACGVGTQQSRLMASVGGVGAQQSCVVADACGVGMDVQLTNGRAMAHVGGVGMDNQPKHKASPTQACRVGMDFGSTD